MKVLFLTFLLIAAISAITTPSTMPKKIVCTGLMTDVFAQISALRVNGCVPKATKHSDKCLAIVGEISKLASKREGGITFWKKAVSTLGKIKGCGKPEDETDPCKKQQNIHNDAIPKIAMARTAVNEAKKALGKLDCPKTSRKLLVALTRRKLSVLTDECAKAKKAINNTGWDLYWWKRAHDKAHQAIGRIRGCVLPGDSLPTKMPIVKAAAECEAITKAKKDAIENLSTCTKDERMMDAIFGSISIGFKVSR